MLAQDLSTNKGALISANRLVDEKMNESKKKKHAPSHFTHNIAFTHYYIIVIIIFFKKKNCACVIGYLKGRQWRLKIHIHISTCLPTCMGWEF